MGDGTFKIASMTALLFRAPVTRAMRTSFAVLRERSALLVRLEDTDGTVGWGEAYCNFPPGSGEHRVTLLQELFTPLLAGKSFHTPDALYDHLSAETAVLALQTGELGPIAQCISGIDIAAWDLFGRRAGKSVRHLLADDAVDDVAVYISGLNPDNPERIAAAEQERGHRAFKLKLGFGRDLDLRNMQAVREAVGAGTPVAVDPNQAWDLDEASAMSEFLAPYAPEWLEEPMPADTGIERWIELARRSPIPLATGENLRGDAVFDAHIASRAFQVIQPDPVKWGGLSGLRRIGRRVSEAGLRFCPHYLGSGLGLVATGHLAAAVGSQTSLLEIDQNENPLREILGCPYPSVTEGRIRLPDGPGLGIAPDLERGSRYLVCRSA